MSESPNASAATKPAVLWTSRVMSALVVLALTMSAMGKLSHGADMVAMWTGKFGFPAETMTIVGVVELSVAILYAIPRTSVLGAILLAAYLGGAFCTHLRAGEMGQGLPAIVLAIVGWGGIYLRDARIRVLIPLRAS